MQKWILYPQKCTKEYVTRMGLVKKYQRYRRLSKMAAQRRPSWIFILALKSKPFVQLCIYLHPCVSFFMLIDLSLNLVRLS